MSEAAQLTTGRVRAPQASSPSLTALAQTRTPPPPPRLRLPSCPTHPPSLPPAAFQPGGIVANSLAVLSDAAHMASDLAGFIVSIVAILLARRSATARLTFGFQRAEVIGAVASVLLIWGLTGFLLAEAVERCVRCPVGRRALGPVLGRLTCAGRRPRGHAAVCCGESQHQAGHGPQLRRRGRRRHVDDHHRPHRPRREPLVRVPSECARRPQPHRASDSCGRDAAGGREIEHAIALVSP